MRASKVSLVLVILLLACAATRAEPFDRRFMIAASKGVVRIEAGQGGSRYLVGTGTVTGPHEVVTAYHVVRGAGHVYVASGGSRNLAAVRRIDPVHDICVLSVEKLEARPLAVRPSGQLQVGEAVAAIGHSGGGGLSLTTGAVVQLHRFSGGEVIETTAPFTSGASGGPLLDSEGRLVGLLVFRGMNGTGHFYAAPVDWLRGDESPVLEETTPFWQEAEALLPYFMRAALLHGESRWEELEKLTLAWGRDEPDNAEPEYVRAQIEAQRGEPKAAARFYARALARDQRYALAWFGLTEAMLELARADCARVAHARLAVLSPALSQRALDAHPELAGAIEVAACELP